MRGATGTRYICLFQDNTSIHAPTWGATSFSCRPSPKCAYFNPCTPCGVRQSRPNRTLFGDYTSIHAPARGATSNPFSSFQSSILQSTHPSGSLHTPATMTSIHAPHTGCDWILPVKRHCGDVTSIHAPHAGCDAYTFVRMFKASHFNSRTPCGVRQHFFTIFALCNNSFIHLRQIVLQLCCLFFLVFTAKFFFDGFLQVRLSLGRNEQWAFAPARDVTRRSLRG